MNTGPASRTHIPYAELGIQSNFSFLRGASHPDELVSQAAALGLAAVGIADRNTLSGAVRAHVAAREAGIPLIVGARLVLGEGEWGEDAEGKEGFSRDLSSGPPSRPESLGGRGTGGGGDGAAMDGLEILCFPTDRAAYGRLCRLLTVGNRRAPKGECWLRLADVLEEAEGQVLIAVPPVRTRDAERPAFTGALARLAAARPGNVFLAATVAYRGDDARRLGVLDRVARRHGTPLVATNDVRYHAPERRMLQDVVTSIREHTTLQAAGRLLDGNAERHVKGPAEMARLFRGYEEALARSVEIARRCTFSLDELRYEYPDEVFGTGTPQQTLERLTWEGVGRRYGADPPARVRDMVRHELDLIEELGYAPYFLTVHDIVRFARGRGILCQGRGSAANSVVCFALGITSVDPAKVDLLFERFVSAERNEPPDIDVDFEHERREEVIQYIYEKYGRHRAGIAATVISYRSRSAIREVGKAMGLSEDVVGALSGTVWGLSDGGIPHDQIREIGLDPADPTLCKAVELATEIIGFPRHLSQHVGGFVITRGPLQEVVPVANAAMEDRTFVEWDKDDLDALGILKIDVLALGMLTCIRKAFELLDRHYGRHVDLATVPPEDPAVYDMICVADTLGVFQIESRAQMSMLPRLKPRSFYDLVIEVAIVRPGPIQGDMVHPYLRRRRGEEAVNFPSPELEHVLGKTLGVPLFQEQAMRIAIVAAGFTPAEADRLRRAMATFRKMGTIHSFEGKLVEGMVARGYDRDFAERCFKQIEGFGEYGFPESHAASFALLVYVSAWLKFHYPAAFACALLNSQPMGFYAPAQIVRDAREHGVTVFAPDVNVSDWDATLEETGEEAEEHEARPARALRLGFRQIKGFKEEDAAALQAARAAAGGRFLSVRDLWMQSGLSTAALERLANADAFRSMGLDRRAALWAVKGLGDEPLPLFAAAERQDRRSLQDEPAVALRDMPLGEHVVNDYATLRLSVKAHPLSFLRDVLDRRGVIPNERLMRVKPGTIVKLAGLVLVRQRPGTASGVIFTTIEDETGIANIIVWPKTFQRFRRTVLAARLLYVEGEVQREGIVIHTIARRLEDMTHALARLSEHHGEMDPALANADEVKRPGEDPRDVALHRLFARQKRTRKILPRSRDFH